MWSFWTGLIGCFGCRNNVDIHLESGDDAAPSHLPRLRFHSSLQVLPDSVTSKISIRGRRSYSTNWNKTDKSFLHSRSKVYTGSIWLSTRAAPHILFTPPIFKIFREDLRPLFLLLFVTFRSLLILLARVPAQIVRSPQRNRQMATSLMDYMTVCSSPGLEAMTSEVKPCMKWYISHFLQPLAMNGDESRVIRHASRTSSDPCPSGSYIRLENLDLASLLELRRVRLSSRVGFLSPGVPLCTKHHLQSLRLLD